MRRSDVAGTFLDLSALIKGSTKRSFDCPHHANHPEPYVSTGGRSTNVRNSTEEHGRPQLIPRRPSRSPRAGSCTATYRKLAPERRFCGRYCGVRPIKTTPTLLRFAFCQPRESAKPLKARSGPGCLSSRCLACTITPAFEMVRFTLNRRQAVSLTH